MEKDYEPFGNEWKTEIKKLPKDRLIKMIREAYIKNIKLESALHNIEISCDPCDNGHEVFWRIASESLKDK